MMFGDIRECCRQSPRISMYSIPCACVCTRSCACIFACVCLHLLHLCACIHCTCLSLYVSVIVRVCHCPCLSLSVSVIVRVCHCPCLSLSVSVIVRVCHCTCHVCIFRSSITPLSPSSSTSSLLAQGRVAYDRRNGTGRYFYGTKICGNCRQKDHDTHECAQPKVRTLEEGGKKGEGAIGGE